MESGETSGADLAGQAPLTPAIFAVPSKETLNKSSFLCSPESSSLIFLDSR
jgi:hypothetical protein